MKRDIGKEILTGLDEIAAWKRGEKKLRAIEVAMPTAADVKIVRDSLGLSQERRGGTTQGGRAAARSKTKAPA